MKIGIDRISDEIIDKIAKDIEEDHDNKVAIAFTKSIGELLRKNGVEAHYTQYNSDVMTEDGISKRYGIVFDSLDFTEHDKVFKDEIKELKGSVEERDSHIKQLKHDVDELKENNVTDELSFGAIEVANFLINTEYECEIPFIRRKTKRRKYDIEDLEQIAEHLLVYCKHNKGEE
nr:MAG TPA: hypothetical protein [Bacteriophage sp.]